MNYSEFCARQLKSLFDVYIEIELENWLSFVHKGDILEVKKNTILKEPHSIEKKLNFIISGSGGILKWHDNNFICLDFLFENSFLCDYNSFLNQKESELETLVFEDSTIFQIHHKKVIKMLHSNRGEKLRRIIAEGIMNSQEEKAKELLTKTAKERYRDLLDTHPYITNRTPHKYIASYLGITPQSFSRLKKEL